MPAVKEAVKTYKDIDSSILKAIPNPTENAYEIKVKIEFLSWRAEQPDFAVI